ncbi:MAG TPA: bifunctional phosphoribosyl-AMP cyclohydrolase/phosphoribosyl-ATP diphosphatase HisIE [Pyrinomonadaceae bacterium]|nr:bifunctional phosphoribosyl-AMP cyclohydrolase/phosphoribosyl-ATP diphosphatase HisIE [Pyrinomonadaceae bacterium]
MSLDVKFDERGLFPAIIQDAETGDVLTLAYMNEESLRRTMETGETWFWSRSRNELWHKGATSGNTQSVVSVTVDCDEDAVLVGVRPHGPACHKGEQSCFHADFATNKPMTRSGDVGFGRQLNQLYRVIESRKCERPEGSYTSYLFDEGLDKILKKVGEETAETIIAAKNADREQFVGEVSDLIYHLLVLLVERDTSLTEISAELARRHEVSTTSR